MTTFTYTATERRSHLQAAVSHGGAYTVKVLQSVITTATIVAENATISFGRIPSNARILGSSRLYWDDLSDAVTPTLDMGLAAVNGNLVQADDPDALNDGLALSAVSTAMAGNILIKDIVNLGLPAWDYVASETADPGGELEVYGSVKDAATAIAGEIVLELYYVVD